MWPTDSKPVSMCQIFFKNLTSSHQWTGLDPPGVARLPTTAPLLQKNLGATLPGQKHLIRSFEICCPVHLYLQS